MYIYTFIFYNGRSITRIPIEATNKQAALKVLHSIAGLTSKPWYILRQKGDEEPKVMHYMTHSYCGNVVRM